MIPYPPITIEDKRRLDIHESRQPSFVGQGEVWVTAMTPETAWYAFFNCGTNDLRVLIHSGMAWEMSGLHMIPNHLLYGLIWKWTLRGEATKQVISNEPIVKVKDLIRRLQRMDPEATVLLSGDFDGNYYKYINLILEELCIGNGISDVDVYCEGDADDLGITDYAEKAVVLYPTC